MARKGDEAGQLSSAAAAVMLPGASGVSGVHVAGSLRTSGGNGGWARAHGNGIDGVGFLHQRTGER